MAATTSQYSPRVCTGCIFFCMSVPMAMLTLLEPGPAHGFALKRRYDGLLGSGMSLKFGQVYSTLARLERDGYAVGLGFESAGAAERRIYAITDDGVTELDRWLRTPTRPSGRPSELFTRVVLAMVSGRSAHEILDDQRQAHLERMRELTKARKDADALTRVAGDFELAHLEADLAWISLAGERLQALEKEIRS